MAPGDAGLWSGQHDGLMEQMRSPDNDTSLAGFRLVRRIGTGSRSTVYLGQARGQTPTVALKVFRLDADGAAPDRQVRAMLALPPAMLAPLRDVATAPDGRLCLVMDRLAGAPLDRLLAERGRIGAGEVVTITATITATLQALHDAGFSHPMIGVDCVRFDGGGRPVLLGLGALEELPAGGAGVSRRRDDLVRLAGWIRSVVEYLDPNTTEAATAGSVLAEFEAAATVRPFPADLTAVESALFAWAPAAAVCGAVPGVAEPHPGAPAGPTTGAITGPGAPPVRLTRPARPVGPEAVLDPPRRAPRDAVWATVGVRVAGWGDALRVRVARLGAARLRARRLGGRPVLVGVGLAGVLSVAGLAMLSLTDSPAATGESTERPVPTAAADVAESAAVPEGAPAGTAVLEETLAATLAGDDPAAAALALLALRERCLAAASVLCLDGADQAGSVAMAADSSAVRQTNGADGAAADEPADLPEKSGLEDSRFTATIQERRGNAALIALTPAAGTAQTQPASALVIRGEAGWRLRELFDY